MDDCVICLACGGAVDEGSGVPEGVEPCSCPPPSVAAATVLCPHCGGSLRVGIRACPFCGSTLATVRCAHCSAWNLAGARHCQRCGRAMAPGAPEDATRTGHACPRCGHGLHARTYGELEVDECDGCGGLMLRPETVDRLVATRDLPTNLRLALPQRSYQREARVTYLRCPACDKTMNRQAFGRISGVVVDVCKNHGIWFDAGELAEVLSFIERGGLAKARERELEELGQARRKAIAERTLAEHAMTGSSGGGSAYFESSNRFDLGREFVAALFKLWG